MFSVPYDPGAAKEPTWQASVDGRLFASKTIFLLLSLPGEDPAIHLAGFRRRSLMTSGDRHQPRKSAKIGFAR
jgi:hypothetical protein